MMVLIPHEARHEAPLPLVPVSVPARYLRQMGTGTGNHIEKPDQSAIKKRDPARMQYDLGVFDHETG